MISMKTDKCPKCGDIVFKLAGRASKLCHDECRKCRDACHDDMMRDEAAQDAFDDERRRLEAEEMERHFAKHPHG